MSFSCLDSNEPVRGSLSAPLRHNAAMERLGCNLTCVLATDVDVDSRSEKNFAKGI